MLILGIETSCDETAAAVVKDGTELLGNAIASSTEMHSKTGGIIPENAAREQIRSILPVINQALQQASGQKEPTTDQANNPSKRTASNMSQSHFIKKIDSIAVTYGPGLIGSLLVGVEAAKTLSYVYNKPIVPVNHLVAHIYANFISRAQNSKLKTQKRSPAFPALALVVSGGHTDLVLVKDHGDIKWVGGTRDDAAGEAFDKCARLLGLTYPGGPAIANQAETFLSHKNSENLNRFPRPIINENNYDWSFSGLKTAVLREVQKTNNIDQKTAEFSAEIQEAIIDVLVEKSIRAIKQFRPKSFLLSGGVAANKRLREIFINRIKQEKLTIDFFAPEPKLATDNAVVIAAAAYYNYSPIPWHEVNANPQLSIVDQLQ